MKKYVFTIIALFFCLSAFSQQTNENKSVALEFALKFDRNMFDKNHFLYRLQDGNFEHISKTGLRANVGTRASFNVSQNNVIFVGFGYNIFRTKTNQESVSMSFWDFELGHRVYVFKLSKFKFHFENSINYTINNEIEKYFLNGVSLELRTGIHIQRFISDNVGIITGVNYGLGLSDFGKSESFFLRSNALGFKFGITKSL